VVRSDQGGEYYGRHTLYGQVPSPFVKCFQENGIVAQYLLPYEMQQNGIAERWNHSLMDIAIELVDGGIKTTAHISSHVPSKSVPKTTYELWTGRKPSIIFFHVWSYLAEAKIFNP
jgi:hypothetical protein